MLFFLAGANFWESTQKTGENRRKNRRFFGANLFGGKNWSVLFFTPFATMERKYNDYEMTGKLVYSDIGPEFFF